MTQKISEEQQNLIIIEVDVNDLRLFGQLIHMYKMMEPDDVRADHALDRLIQQTNVVFRNPKTHGVYEKPLSSPPEAKPSPPIYYIRDA